MKRRIVLVLILGFALLVAGSVLFWPISTHSNAQYPKGVYTIKEVQLKQQRMRVMIRSHQAGNPILLIIPDSFGAPLGLYSQYLRTLEPYFTVVTFAYQGYHLQDTSLLEQLRDDVMLLTDYIKKEVFADEVLLAGHGMGSVIAAEVLLADPQSYLGYVGIAQYQDILQTQVQVLAKLEEKATLDSKQATQIRTLQEKFASKSFILEQEWLMKQKRPAMAFSYPIGKLHGMLFQSEQNGWELLQYERLQEKLRPLWNQEMLATAWHLQQELSVPCMLIGGRYDYIVPADHLLEEAEQANCQEAYFFDASAHFPHLEEESLFYQRVLDFYHKLNSEK